MKKLLSTMILVGLAAVVTNCQQKKPEVAPAPQHSLKSIYYDYDESFIRGDMVTNMRGNASYLKGNNESVQIEGNCDQRGTNEYNMALGHRRAESAKNYLMNLGVNTSRMKTVSWGEERPVCTQMNESCWQRNRRADFRKTR